MVELGTDEGGFAAFLADLVRPWGGHVTSFDIAARWAPSLVRIPNLTLVQGDVLVAGGNPDVRRLLVGGVLLYCDNGNKQREVELYAAHLPEGAILGVHDYNSEIMAEWVEPFVADLGFTPLGHDRMEALRNEWYPEPMTRFWFRWKVAP